jgi:hypothetical protein
MHIKIEIRKFHFQGQCFDSSSSSTKWQVPLAVGSAVTELKKFHDFITMVCFLVIINLHETVGQRRMPKVSSLTCLSEFMYDCLYKFVQK